MAVLLNRRLSLLQSTTSLLPRLVSRWVQALRPASWIHYLGRGEVLVLLFTSLILEFWVSHLTKGLLLIEVGVSALGCSTFRAPVLLHFTGSFVAGRRWISVLYHTRTEDVVFKRVFARRARLTAIIAIVVIGCAFQLFLVSIFFWFIVTCRAGDTLILIHRLYHLLVVLQLLPVEQGACRVMLCFFLSSGGRPTTWMYVLLSWSWWWL